MLMIAQAPSAIAAAAVRGRGDRLVEADGRRDLPGELGVAERCRPRPAAARSAAGRTGRAWPGGGRRPSVYAVLASTWSSTIVAEALAHRAHRLDVPARLDLQLDAHGSPRRGSRRRRRAAPGSSP